MKNLLLTLTVAAALSAPAELKIAVINLSDVVRLQPQHETNLQLVKSTNRDYKAKLDRQQDAAREIVEEGKRLQTDLQNPMLTAKAKADVQRKLENVQQKLLNARQELDAAARRCQLELSDLETRLMKLETEDLRKKIADWAKKAGYDLVVDYAALGFAKDSLDATDAFLRAQGIDPARRRGSGEKSAAPEK